MKKSKVKKSVKDEFLKDTNFLSHIGYFCHDSKKAKQIKEPQIYTENIAVPGEQLEIAYTISPDSEFGYPSVTAYDIWNLVVRLLEHYGRPAQNPIPFKMVTLRKFSGLKKSARNDRIIKNALHQLRATEIKTTCFFLDFNGKSISIEYTLIKKLAFVVSDEDEVLNGLIYLNKHIIDSFNN